MEVTVYYLEMLQAARMSVPVPQEELQVISSQKPTVAYYRFLYNSVGRDYRWLSRRKLSDDALAEIIHDPLNELHVLHVNGTPAGFAELDRRQPQEVELTQFGLIADHIGRGLGKWFLQWTIDRVWSYDPNRFWLHTCSLDHEAALPNYKRAGFREFKREQIQREF